MMTTLPAVQYGCKKAGRVIKCSARVKRSDKRIANRRHRRVLNAITRGFLLEPEKFESETFNSDVPSLSPWDIY